MHRVPRLLDHYVAYGVKLQDFCGLFKEKAVALKCVLFLCIVRIVVLNFKIKYHFQLAMNFDKVISGSSAQDSIHDKYSIFSHLALNDRI